MMAEPSDDPPPSKREEDVIISKREFEVGEGVDISSFMMDEFASSDELESESTEDPEEVVDEALGSLPELFTGKGTTKDSDDAVDPRKSEAVEAEQKVHWAMMVLMVILWSITGTYVGLSFSAAIAGPALLLMALFSFWLAHIWIRNPSMRILGTTWAIIGMKLLYGLAIDLHHWDLLDGTGVSGETMLGILLLLMVSLNIFLAYHFDEDAIAAQATLVLLAVGSAAGAIYGELGVALMIGIATVILHSLALMRNSGNLTSLGVATTNLWIGLHALSSDWTILGLEILPFKDPLVLLLLTLFVNAANAAMAANFAHRENWFSQGASALGLGTPGLWGVSVGLGMFGALLAIFAHRDETGFALALITILMTAFGASYLVVRGVDTSRILPTVLLPTPFLVGALVLFDTGILEFTLLSGHALFASGMGLVAATTLLRNQNAVSDHVLWLGTLVGAVLVTILIPSDEGEYGDVLLVGLTMMFAVLGAFAVKRSSPSIAGVAVLAPWIWILVFATDIENRFVSADVLPIVLDPEILTVFMFAMGLLQVGVNLTMGETGVDLGKAFGSGTEAMARIRDSGVLRLWTMGWLFALLGWLAVARPDGLPAMGLVFGVVSLGAMHISVQTAGRHVDQRRFLFITLAVATIWAHWRFGLTLAWIPTMVIAGIALAWDASRKDPEGALDLENRPESLLTLMFSFLTAHLVLASLGLDTLDLLSGAFWPDSTFTLWAVVISAALALAAFLPRASSFEQPLGPSLSCVAMLLSLMIWTNQEDGSAFLLAGAMFAGSGLWLISQGEIRIGLASLAKVKEKSQVAEERRQAIDIGIDGSEVSEMSETQTEVGLIDAEMIHQAAKQAKRRKRAGSIGDMDLVAGDVHYSPTIVLVFVAIIALSASWSAYFNGNGEAMLLLTSLLVVASVLLAQHRAKNLEMRMPDIMGIEIPVAVSIGSIVLVHLAGRVSQQHVDPDAQLGILILTLALCALAWISLQGRKDLALRLPSALEWILYGLVVDRLATMLFSGGVPPPLQVDPFDGVLNEWVVPWLVLELVLVIVLLLFDMVERKRLERDLQDHRGADGRSLWIVMVMLVSWGPATILAAGLALLRARSWNQPGLAVTAIVLIPIAFAQSDNWLPSIDNFVALSTLLTGLLCFGLLAASVNMGQPRWSTAWLWDIHLLMPIGALLFSGGVDAIGVVSVLAISGAAWVSGVLEERRSWRVIGFLDLLAAWVIAALALSVGKITTALLLPMLLASVILLGIVTWLGQSRSERLAID